MTVDFSEIFGAVNRPPDDSGMIKKKLSEIRTYVKHDSVPSAAKLRMTKLGAAISDWMAVNGIQASALQCRNSL